MKLAVIDKEKCRPTMCGHECKKYCPIEKEEPESCITIGAPANTVEGEGNDHTKYLNSKARIDENTCIGCSICVKRCPFDAIKIINLPSVSEEDLVHRYGENAFALYGLPTPKEGSILGLLGRNGIGKSTAVKLLSGRENINLGKDASALDVKKFFAGNEILRYFEDLKNKKISYKPQNLSELVVPVPVMELLIKRGPEDEINSLAKLLEVTHVLGNEMDKLSGGELQRIAILASCLGKSDIYFFDEPLAFLDIGERLRVSEFIRGLATGPAQGVPSSNGEKSQSSAGTVIVVEHDLLILDYLTDSLNIFFGEQGAYGAVSGVKTSKYGVNSYLEGFLKEENLRIRDKALNFNFTKNQGSIGLKISSWPEFKVKFDSGFELSTPAGEIRENHVIGILGKNGTGKTTFVKALAGLVSTDKGNLNLDLEISYKPQYLFTEDENIVRDVCFKEKINKKISSVFNLGVLHSKKMKDLSGGELQRLNVARCLAKDADIYLIDEPSAYLDVEERISVAKAIKDVMVEKSKTAFVVDHDLLLVSYLADSVINFEGESGKVGVASEINDFEIGVGKLLKSLDITLRKDDESGRPRINKKGSVLDREQKARGDYVVF